MRQSLVSPDGQAILTKALNGKMACAALSGEIGKQCKCGIYKQRPMVCQVFEVGSTECLEARLRFGL
jgi:Fe-S-cluster containining protein